MENNLEAKKESSYIKTTELAQRLGLKPHTIKVWAGNGKQKRDGFPKPKFRSDELNWLRQEIVDWENGKQF
ncbi:putative DNA-binding transcriptional regulator AlpA [Providencia alcalifaciens]|nr:putative DNA-binding transcriptional regulator AlpA [Providencia alcalifaciens]